MPILNAFASFVDVWLRRAWRLDAAKVASVSQGMPATIITGGSEGIGRAIADEFARRGDTVVLVARSAPALGTAAADIEASYGAKVHWLALDVTDGASHEILTSFLNEHGLYADILVNNAGMGLAGPFATQDPGEIARLIHLNVEALTRLSRHALPDMCTRGRGGLLNIASLAGYAPGPYQAAYYASKAYVIALTRALASETGGQGVRVSVLAPGPVETEFHRRMGAHTALYRTALPGMRPRAVARSALRGFALGHKVILPGFLAPLLALFMRVLPDIVIVPIVGWLLKPRGRPDA